jgi:hypothetical protein
MTNDDEFEICDNSDALYAISGLERVKTWLIEPVVLAFRQNANNALNLGDFPLGMFDLGMRYKAAQIAERLKKPEIIVTDILEFSDAETVQQAIAQLTSDVVQRADEDGFAVFMDDIRCGFRDCCRTAMSAQLVLGWTAFETLAGDLWETAVNTCPKTLASMKSAKGQGREDGKLLPMSYLERYQFDVKNRMGTILKHHRCDFTSLGGIAEAYRLAFPPGSEVSDDRLWAHADLKACALVRNLIVHKAGIVDAEFIRKRGSDPRFASFTEGNPLNLGAKVTQSLLAGLFEFSSSLIRAVDDWLARNRKLE